MLSIPPGRKTARVDPLLQEGEGLVAALLGNEAIVRGALEAGVAFACGYPGTPSSEVTDSFARVAKDRGIVFEYSVNEKVSAETAFAASLAGARSICAMKHLGLMVAGDPLSTIPYVGVRAGMVIVSAADPSCLTSPNEQDQRHLGPMLHLPVLDPATPQQAHDMTLHAFELSEASRLPVLLRITTRAAHTRASVRCGPLREPQVTGFVRDPAALTPIPVNARRMRLEIPDRLERARQAMAAAGLFRRQGEGRRAILATGVPAATTADLLAEHGVTGEVVLATVGGVHPLPEPELLQLLEDVDEVLVVEELSPFLEDALAALAARSGVAVTILGKRSGHLPTPFEYEPQVIQAGIHSAFGLVPEPPSAAAPEGVAPRPPSLCPGCPHRSTYFAAKAAFDGSDEHLYFNDIGCYTLGYGPPLNTVDALLCMGAGFSLAAGVARVTGRRTVGFIGDSTFFHAGMPALLGAIKEKVNMVAVILDNQVTAMTGFQESPTVHFENLEPHRDVSIEGVVRALGAKHVEVIDPTNLSASIAAFERARDASGVSVVIAVEPCPIHLARETRQPTGVHVFEIDQDRCRACGRQGCNMRCSQGVTPGLEWHMSRGQAMQIDPATPRNELREAEPIERLGVAPCATRCPLSLCVQGYAGHIASGQYREAVELIMSRCPLPDSVCRLCHRPCEAVCVHADGGEPVAINDLKRFVMDWAATQDTPVHETHTEPGNGRSVAVVGAGPAGLAAAHALRRRGYRVKLLDADDEPGGLLRSGIPAFRLPRDVLQRDIDRILGLGVEFEGGRALGADLQLSDLLEDGYDAVFLAVGAHRPVRLELPGANSSGAPPMVDALGYLQDVLAGEAPPAAARVVVIGGGNAALDAARLARRGIADHVRIVYRRRREEMPALPDEIEAALAEGIEILAQMQPLELTAEGLVCLRTEPGAEDASGRAHPRAVPNTETHVEADLVVVAAGQSPETDFLAVGEQRLERHGDGSLVVDELSLATSHPRVFAGGDVVRGERTLTSAIALGQRAAWGIDRALRGREAADTLPPPVRAGDEGDWPRQGRLRSRFLYEGPQARRRPPEITLEQRLGSHDEVHAALDETAARAEAARCQSCGQCGNCRACLDLFGCPAFYMEDDRIFIDASLCNGCAVCAEFCPNGAIRPRARSRS